MNQDQIDEGVREAVGRWIEFSRYRERRYELTDGAVRLLVQLVASIEEDPSPFWRATNYEAAQRYVIAVIPNMLLDLENQYGRHWMDQRISSWEILHGISPLLSKWCPIPKDI